MELLYHSKKAKQINNTVVYFDFDLILGELWQLVFASSYKVCVKKLMSPPPNPISTTHDTKFNCSLCADICAWCWAIF